MVQNTNVCTVPGPAMTITRNTDFNLPEKYEAIKMVGAGADGTVISATNKDTGSKVAIKKLSQAIDTIDAKRQLREIIIMKNLIHENVSNLSDVIYVPTEGDTPTWDTYLVCDLEETDLHRVIRSR